MISLLEHFVRRAQTTNSMPPSQRRPSTDYRHVHFVYGQPNATIRCIQHASTEKLKRVLRVNSYVRKVTTKYPSTYAEASAIEPTNHFLNTPHSKHFLGATHHQLLIQTELQHSERKNTRVSMTMRPLRLTAEQQPNSNNYQYHETRPKRMIDSSLQMSSVLCDPFPELNLYMVHGLICITLNSPSPSRPVPA